MYDLLEGLRVVEVAEFLMVPAASMILADWGANVIKVENRDDSGSIRSFKVGDIASAPAVNVLFEMVNRGKRSLGLDLKDPAGRALLDTLLMQADVFVTNLRKSTREKLRLEPADIMAVNPRIVYARGSGYGTRGPKGGDGGYDWPSSWCQSGMAYMQTGDRDEPPMQPCSVGDMSSGASLAGGICAALLRRERTGKGAVVDISLYQMGMFLMSHPITRAAVEKVEVQPSPSRRDNGFPAIANTYRTKDGRWLALCMLQDRWWGDLITHMGAAPLSEDPRFATRTAREANRNELIDEFERIFASRTLSEWKEALRTTEGVWAPIHSPNEILDDIQARTMGYLIDVQLDAGDSYTGCASPCQFDEQPVGHVRAAPHKGSDTKAVLAEFGLEPDMIEDLQDRGVIY